MLLGIREANDVEGEVERYLTDIYIVEIYLLCAKKKKKVPESPAATSE